MFRLFTTGRGQFALALLVIVAALLVWMQRHVTHAEAPLFTDENQGGQVYYTASQTAVFWNRECVDLTWQLSGITEVYLNDVATVGEQTETWCLPPTETYRGFYRDPAVAELRVRFMDGEIRRYMLPVYAMQPLVERIVVPLALVAMLLAGSLYVPSRFVDPLTRQRQLPEDLRNFRVRRGSVAMVYVLLAAGIFALLVYRSMAAPPYQQAYTFADATLTTTVDPPLVFRSNGCTVLSWQTENVSVLTLDGETISLTGEREWCLPLRSSNSIVQFEIEAENGETQRRTVYVAAAQPMLYYTVLPLLVLVAYFAGWVPLAWLDAPRFANNRVLAPFYRDGRLNRLLFALFMTVNVIVISNVFRHNAALAYDAEDHFMYSIVLSQGRWPVESESNQFFAPPLVYAFPALVHTAVTAVGLEPCTAHEGEQRACQIVAKAAQLQNIIAAVGITYLLVRICGLIRMDDDLLKIHALAVLAMLPVFYKTMVFHRGEPFVALFTLVITHHILIMLQKDRRSLLLADGLMLGIGFGLLVISRQWGVIAAAGISVWALLAIIYRGRAGVPLLRTGLVGYGIAAITGGWFYLLTQMRLGSATAFNRAPEEAANFFARKPLDFYIGMGSGTVFEMPFRSARIAQILPIMYTDLWGDYWGHFHLPGADFSVWSAAPPPQPIAYMVRVNGVSVLATVVLLAGFVWGSTQLYRWLRWREDAAAPYALMQTTILVSLAGYLWFLIGYPHSVGDTIKAAYILHVYPLLAVTCGAFLLRVRGWNAWLYSVIVAVLVVTALHNLPMLFTQYAGQGM